MLVVVETRCMALLHCLLHCLQLILICIYFAGSRHHWTSQVRQRLLADHSASPCTFKQFVLAVRASWCFALLIVFISADVAIHIFSLLTIMVCASTVVQLTNKHSSGTREAATSLQSQMPCRPEKSTRGNYRYTFSLAHFTYTRR